MRGKVRDRYYLEKSDNAGLTYKIVAESNRLEKLKEFGDLLDLQPVRWLIKDRWTSSIMDKSSLHLSILSLLTNNKVTRDTFEPYVIPSEQIDSYESKKEARKLKILDIQKRLEGKQK